jgi:polyferredoxin
MIGTIFGGIAPFFEQQTKKRSLRPQFVIALIAGFTFALDMGAVYLTIGKATQIYGPVMFILIAGYVFAPIGLWFLVALGVYLLGRSFGARIQFGVFFRTAGWGLVPMIAVGPILAAGRYLALAPEQP